MASFSFTSSQGRFSVPDGESRMGSDSTCPIYIQGEGVHPVHAYLKVDGEKLMIRPSSEKSTVLVDGQPIGGPHALQDGQQVTIGPVQLRLESSARGRLPLLKKKWFRVALYIGGGALALVLLAVLLRLLWFNDNWFKARIVEQVDEALSRDDTEIESVSVGLMDGTLKIRNLRVPNKEPAEAKDLLHVDEIDGSLDAWALFKSWLAGPLVVRASALKMTGPRLFVERFERDGHEASNIDDILERYLQGPPRTYPFDLGLASLETSVTIEGGQVLLDDRYTRLGKTSIENIRVYLAQQGLGSDLRFEASAEMKTPERDCGKLSLKSGQFLLINRAGAINPDDIGNGAANLRLEKFDLARLFSHLEWSLPVNRGEQRLVLGKPVTGDFKVSFQDLKNYLLTGSAESESLVSVLEKDQPPVGNIPTKLDVDLNYNVDKGPMQISLVLRSASSLAAVRDPTQPQILVLRADGKRDPAGDYRYDVKLKAILQDLFATDVGDRLKLKGRLRGGLDGDAAVTFAKGEMKIDGVLAQKGEAFVPHPTEAGKGEWIPTNVRAECNATALPNDRGEISNLEARFKAKADSKSFEAESLTPATFENLDHPEKLKVRAQFKLNLQGREFWKEFGAYMKLIGFSEPVEERADLKVTVYSGPETDPKNGDQHQISIGLRGKSEAQWNPDLPAVELLALLEYYPDLLTTSTAAPLPYLKLTLQTGDEQTPPYVRLENAELTHAGHHQTLTVPLLRVESDLTALRERFDPYFRSIAKFLGTNAYDTYRLTGFPKAQSKLSLAWDAEPRADGTREIEAAYDVAVEGQNLSVEGPVPGQTPKDGEAQRRWTWTEPKVGFTLKGGYRKKPAATKEDPDFHRLDLDELDMKGSLGAFKLRAKDLDLWLLEKLLDRKARLPGKVLPDAVKEFAFAGTVESAAFDLLRRLELMPADPPVTGQLKLQADYKRDTGRLALKELVFSNDEEGGFWLRDLDAVAGLHGVREIFLAANAGGAGIGTSLLEHLDEFLVVKSLTLDAGGFTRWVIDGPELAAERHVPETLVRLLTSRRVVPSGQWTIKDLALRPAAGRDRTWSLIGHFQNDLAFALPAGTDGKPRALSIRGPWTIRESDASAISFTEDYKNVSLILNANFELADLSLPRALPNWDYRKPAGQALTLGVVASHSPGGPNRDTIVYIDNARLIGGPMRVELSGAELRSKSDAKGDALKTLALQAGSLDGGPLKWDAKEPCTVERLGYDGETNQIHGTFKVPRMDAEYLATLGLKPGPFAARGMVENLVCEFNGDLDRLRALDPLPAQDRLDVKGQLKDLRLSAETPGKEKISALLNGAWAMSNSEVNSLNMDVALTHTAAPVAGQAGKETLFSATLDGLWIASRDERKNLRQAVSEKVMPLQVKLPLRFKTAVKDDELGAAVEALRKILSDQGVALARGNPFDPLAQMNLDGSVSAPAFTFGGDAIDQFVAPKFTLKDLKLNVPILTGQFANGALSVSAFSGDLSTATAEFPLHIKHSYTIKLLKADLPRLLFGAQPAPKAGHRAEGQVSLEGVMQGNGFEPAARRTWQGGVELGFQNLTLSLAPEVQKGERKDRRPAWAKLLSPDAVSLLVVLGSRHTATAKDFIANSPALSGIVDRTEALSKATLFGVDLFLSRLGLEGERLEFEPFKVLVTVTNGLGEIKPAPQSKMLAKGGAAGLELRVAGKLQLWDYGIDDTLHVAVLALPDPWKDKLALPLWPADKREQFLRDLSDGGLALRMNGALENPQFEYPTEKLNRYAMEAVFGTEKIKDAAGFDAAAAFLKASEWGQSEKNTDAAASLLDRMGIGLPGTETHKLQGWNLLDRATGLPQYIKDKLSPLNETITPEESLRKLLAPPPAPNPKDPPKKEAPEK
ncbi:MAG: FHA domain-containing protein [Planctomycetota bacterium]|nr:FHA domain-containing protein [Planctomycetota bacterium]